MRQFPERPLLLLFVASLLLSGCGDAPSSSPAAARQTYGAAVDATDAVPVSAVAAELDRYVGRRVTVDGRIEKVGQNGCTLHLAIDDEPSLRVEAGRLDDGSCAWRVSPDVGGFAVASGPLRTVRDTLRLSARGVQVTPLQVRQ
jgi:hypothetical protein